MRVTTKGMKKEQREDKTIKIKQEMNTRHRPPPLLQKAPPDRGLALRAYSKHHQVQFMLECDWRESIPIIARVESNLAFLQLVPIKY